MDGDVNQEIKAVGIRKSMRWREIKTVQKGRHVNERMDLCYEAVYKLRNQYSLQILMRWPRRHQHEFDVGCR